MYMLGPRLEPILTALLILAHMVLPIVHGAAFYVVYSYYKTPRIILPADAGNNGNFFRRQSAQNPVFGENTTIASSSQ